MATPISEARLLANRKNAQLSTGPRTSEGKARARTNAVKHGLTGAGIALPAEDAAIVELRFSEMQADLAPTTLEGRLLVHLAALMSVQIERSARHQTAMVAMAGRHAADEFDLARLAEVDRLFDTIDTNPREHHRRLQTTIEGVDRLLAALQGVRDQLRSGSYKTWTVVDRNKVDCFLGGSVSKFPMSRCDAVMFAIAGNPAHIPQSELAQIPEGWTRDRYFRDELIALVDAERTRLAQVRATIDPSIVADDRREAVDRARVILSTEAILAKKYQTAAINTFLRSLRDFHKLEQGEAEAPDEPAQTASSEPVMTPPALPVPLEPTPVVESQSPISNEPRATLRRDTLSRILDEPPPSQSTPIYPFTASR